jgi:hypothetical protein
MALRVPPQAELAIQNLLDLPDEVIQQFLKALKSAGSKFNTNDLALDVSNATKIPRQLTDPIVQVLASLYVAREEAAVDLDAFLDRDVKSALRKRLVASEEKGKAPAPAEIEIRWNKLRVFLAEALALDETVGTAAKTGPVLTEHERIFVSARVLTDIRPIFHPNLSEKPNAAVIVHMLRIVTRDIFSSQYVEYFALDANDIRLMKNIMERAIRKEETLKTLLAESNVDTISPKSFF